MHTESGLWEGSLQSKPIYDYAEPQCGTMTGTSAKCRCWMRTAVDVRAKNHLRPIRYRVRARGLRLKDEVDGRSNILKPP